MSGLLLGVLLGAVAAAPPCAAVLAPGALGPAATVRPLEFEANRGQAAPEVAFLSRGPGFVLYLTPAEAVFARTPEVEAPPRGVAARATGPLASPTAPEPAVVRLRWLGGRAARFEGLEPAAGVSRYLPFGRPGARATEAPRFRRVVLHEVWPGIDVVFYDRQGRLEHDFVVAPGADPGRIRLAVDGGEVSRTDDGALEIPFARDPLRFEDPVAYQERHDGTRERVAAAYRIAEDRSAISVELGPHDPSRPLIVDPIVAYSTYLGGSDIDRIVAVDLDSDGDVVVAGTTSSTDFPVEGGNSHFGGQDVFVARLSPDGSDLLFSTYLGGAGTDEIASDLALDSSGNLWVVGFTSGSPSVVFVSKFDPAGTTNLFFDELTGLSGDAYAYAVAVDGDDDVFVAGSTWADDFPTVDPFQPTYAGDGDGFLRKYSSAGAVLFSTYLGATGIQEIYDVAAGPAGNPTLVGFTTAVDATGDVALLRMTGAGDAIVYASIFGGDLQDAAWGVDVDSTGDAVVVGSTHSSDFPTVDAFQPVHGGGEDAFLRRVDGTGTAEVSTYLGGEDNDRAEDVAVRPNGSFYVAGIVQDGSVSRAVLQQVNAGLSGVVWQATLGLSATAHAVAVDASGHGVFAGIARNFPVTPGAYQTSNPSASRSGFVTRISPQSPTLVIDDVEVTERDSTPVEMPFAVRLSDRSPVEVTVDLDSLDDTATAGVDYGALSGEVSFSPFQRTVTVSGAAIGDLLDEIDETYFVDLSSPVNATITDSRAVGTILDNDPLPSLSVTGCGVVENDLGDDCTFVVDLSAPSGRTVSVGWATADGTATAGDDYVEASGSRTFAPGQTSKNVAVEVVDDELVELLETFTLTLSGPTNATIADGQGTGEIVDDDSDPIFSDGFESGDTSLWN